MVEYNSGEDVDLAFSYTYQTSKHLAQLAS